MYKILALILKAFGNLPLRVLYLFSDLLYFILRYVVKYRSKVILTNLEIAFPEKSKKERLQIRNKFYRNFSDFLVETIKMFGNSGDFINKHYELDTETYEKLYSYGTSIILASGHQFTWEWGAWSLPMNTKFQILAFYLPLSNKFFDELIKQTRERFGTIAISAKEFRKMIKLMREKQSIAVIIADQSPANLETAYYVNFFGKETPFLPGMEKTARLLNIPVVVTEIIKKKRGLYQVQTTILAEKPRELKEGELTQRFATFLEKSIKKHPDNWLWSHKRWKHIKEGNPYN